jgi:hypothetical protein
MRTVETSWILISTFIGMLACSPQAGNESENKELNKSNARQTGAAPGSQNMGGRDPRDDKAQIPDPIRIALKDLAEALGPIYIETLTLAASSGGIIDRLPIEQRKFFYGLNQEIFDCTIGQFKAIDLRDRFKACELANACRVKLGNVERNYFDIHAELSDSYRVLQDAAEVNSSNCAPFRRGPVGFP